MGRVGRFVCVSLPFALTVCSLACILIVVLTGVTSNGLYLFQVNTKDLSISVNDLSTLTKRGEHMTLGGSGVAGALTEASGENITAADLGLYDSYTISLWNYCYTSGSTTTCTPAKFDWAANATNITTTLTNIAAANGVKFADESLINGVKSFSLVVKYTEIVYIIAGVFAVLELAIGLFAFCSRIGSCCTFIVSAFSTIAVIAAASLATVMAALVVGAISALNKFGVSASFNTTFLAIAWLGVLFSMGAGLFWLFSICCCSPGHRERRDNRRSMAADEKPYSGYQRVNDPFLPKDHMSQETGYIPPTQPVAAQRYEPYSHTQV